MWDPSGPLPGGFLAPSCFGMGHSRRFKNPLASRVAGLSSFVSISDNPALGPGEARPLATFSALFRFAHFILRVIKVPVGILAGPWLSSSHFQMPYQGIHTRDDHIRKF